MLHINDPSAPERAKYAEISILPEYNVVHPGLESADWFLDVLDPRAGETVIDIGCGAGGAGLKLAERGLQVTWLDLVDVRLDSTIDRKRFIQSCLWDCSWPLRRRIGWDYGFCVDVMEHLPTEYTMLVLDRIVSCCRTSWLQIACAPETHGDLINQRLHLTVRDFEWWRDRIATVGNLVDARDIFPRALFVVKQK